jgi:hypothetical protein
MMDMIKSVEINSSILELYLVKLHACYASVLDDAKQEREAALLAMRVDLEQHTPAGRALRNEMAAVELRVAAAEQHGWALLAAAAAVCATALLLSVVACALALQQRRELAALRQSQRQAGGQESCGPSSASRRPQAQQEASRSAVSPVRGSATVVPHAEATAASARSERPSLWPDAPSPSPPAGHSRSHEQEWSSPTNQPRKQTKHAGSGAPTASPPSPPSPRAPPDLDVNTKVKLEELSTNLQSKEAPLPTDISCG